MKTKSGIVETEEKTLAKKRPINKTWQLDSVTRDKHATREELLTTVFSA
jgi:hypothetical protein